VGIGGMRQRIKELGGELMLRKGHPGTIVEAVIPLVPMTSAARAVQISAL
jgi:signal transduction histidine kinase